MTQLIELKQGDSFELLARMEEGSIGAVITDPPYGLSFMGKEWDSVSGGWHSRWLSEAFRVLRPGGIIKVFGATRTHHRLAAAMEQVGFVDISLTGWLYGSGFPKSLNVRTKLKEVDSELAQKFDGYGTALKPGWEPFIVGRKPDVEI